VHSVFGKINYGCLKHKSLTWDWYCHLVGHRASFSYMAFELCSLDQKSQHQQYYSSSVDARAGKAYSMDSKYEVTPLTDQFSPNTPYIDEIGCTRLSPD
jgi:hypothetical protein